MAEPVRAIFCGSRDWWRARAIIEAIDNLPRGSVVIHGGARGADQIAANVARGRGFETVCFPYPEGLGKGGGPVRNKQMLEEGRADVVYAFKEHFDTTLNRGSTENMVKIARLAGIPTIIVTEQ